MRSQLLKADTLLNGGRYRKMIVASSAKPERGLIAQIGLTTYKGTSGWSKSCCILRSTMRIIVSSVVTAARSPSNVS